MVLGICHFKESPCEINDGKTKWHGCAQSLSDAATLPSCVTNVKNSTIRVMIFESSICYLLQDDSIYLYTHTHIYVIDSDPQKD